MSKKLRLFSDHLNESCPQSCTQFFDHTHIHTQEGVTVNYVMKYDNFLHNFLVFIFLQFVSIIIFIITEFGKGL